MPKTEASTSLRVSGTTSHDAWHWPYAQWLLDGTGVMRYMVLGPLNICNVVVSVTCMPLTSCTSTSHDVHVMQNAERTIRIGFHFVVRFLFSYCLCLLPSMMLCFIIVVVHENNAVRFGAVHEFSLTCYCRRSHAQCILHACGYIWYTGSLMFDNVKVRCHMGRHDVNVTLSHFQWRTSHGTLAYKYRSWCLRFLHDINVMHSHSVWHECHAKTWDASHMKLMAPAEHARLTPDARLR